MESMVNVNEVWAYALLVLAGIVTGILVYRRFGTDWMAILAWAVNTEELVEIAEMLWESEEPVLLHKALRLLFRSEEAFVAWVKAKCDSLAVEKLDAAWEARLAKKEAL